MIDKLAIKVDCYFQQSKIYRPLCHQGTNAGEHAKLLTQQQARTLICIVFLPALQTSFRRSGLCDVFESPRSRLSGVLLTLTLTVCGQFVVMVLSSWW